MHNFNKGTTGLSLLVFCDTPPRHRAPLYPPLKISIAVGGSPSHMQPVLTLVPVAVTEEPQTFLLPAHAPVGRYLRITLHGRQQMQLEDGRYYVAIR